MAVVYIIASALNSDHPFLISQVLFQHLDLAMDFMHQCLRAILEPLTTPVLTNRNVTFSKQPPASQFPYFPPFPFLSHFASVPSNYFKVTLWFRLAWDFWQSVLPFQFPNMHWLPVEKRKGFLLYWDRLKHLPTPGTVSNWKYNNAVLWVGQ